MFKCPGIATTSRRQATREVDNCGRATCPRCVGVGSVATDGPEADHLAALSPRRARFVAEVVRGSSYAAAARAAGYSPHSARKIGSRLMQVAEVATAVAAILAETDLGAIDPAAVARQVEDTAVEGTPLERLRALDLLARAAGLRDGHYPEAVDWDPRHIAWAVDDLAMDQTIAPAIRLGALDLLSRIAGFCPPGG